jgi:hypothetical protein
MSSDDEESHVQDPEATEEEHRQYGHGPVSEADLDKLYGPEVCPRRRPKNKIFSGEHYWLIRGGWP